MDYGLFKEENPRKGQFVYRVENLNPDKGIFASYRHIKDQKKHVVVLCLADKTVKTVFKNKWSAIEKLNKYKEYYKELKANK